jgi:hypothetical protein
MSSNEVVAGSLKSAQAEGFSAWRLASTAVIVSISLEKIMPNNTMEDQNATNNAPAEEDENTEANNAPDKDDAATSSPKTQVTTNPSIKNY